MFFVSPDVRASPSFAENVISDPLTFTSAPLLTTTAPLGIAIVRSTWRFSEPLFFIVAVIVMNLILDLVKALVDPREVAKGD